MANGLVQARVSGWAATAVCSAMFAGITWLHDFLDTRSGWTVLLGMLASAAAGWIGYRILLTAFIWLFERSALVRQLLLGIRYVEGTWIGFYERGGEVLLSIERIDQRSEQIDIAGRAIDRAGGLHTQWNSTSAAITPSGKLLFYSYDCTVLGPNKRHEGLAKFQVDQIALGSPIKMIGYSADLTDGKADANTEYRAGSIDMTDEEIFAAARVKFPAQFGTNWPTS